MSDDAARAIESILMVTSDPVEPGILAQLLEIPVARVEELIADLSDQYATESRGFIIVKVAGGYRYQSHPDLAAYVERFVLEGQTGRLSAAALETLAIVAYKQPVSRAQMAAIRGVAVDGVVRTLVHRELIDEIGRDTGPGQAVLYGTTPLFLERLGLDTVDELPALGDFVPGPDVIEALEQGLRAPLTDDVTVVNDDEDMPPQDPATAANESNETEEHPSDGPEDPAEAADGDSADHADEVADEAAEDESADAADDDDDDDGAEPDGDGTAEDSESDR